MEEEEPITRGTKYTYLPVRLPACQSTNHGPKYGLYEKDISIQIENRLIYFICSEKTLE